MNKESKIERKRLGWLLWVIGTICISGWIAVSFTFSYHLNNLGMSVDLWYVTVLPLVLFTVGISIVLVLFYKSYSKTLHVKEA